MIKTLYIFRHGETDWNKIEKLQGHADTPLNDRGREQALELARVLMDKRPQIILSSDLTRAHDTARIIAAELGSLPVQTASGLRELHLGLVQGMTRTALRQKYGPEMWMRMEFNNPEWDDSSFPEGETKRAATSRALRTLTRFLETTSYERIGIATHGFLIKLLIVAMTQDYDFPFDIPNGRFFEVHYHMESGSFKLADNC
jgi:probable phosphoglycerate mutase